MGYHSRVLSCLDDYPSVSELATALREEFPGAEFSADPGYVSEWTEAILANAAGDEIAMVERTPVAARTLGSAEIAEFLEGLAASLPDGFHILWDFSDDVDGEWNMAVLDGESWVPSRMDLGNKEHREAYLSGRIPRGAELL